MTPSIFNEFQKGKYLIFGTFLVNENTTIR